MTPCNLRKVLLLSTACCAITPVDTAPTLPVIPIETVARPLAPGRCATRREKSGIPEGTWSASWLPSNGPQFLHGFRARALGPDEVGREVVILHNGFPEGRSPDAALDRR